MIRRNLLVVFLLASVAINLFLLGGIGIRMSNMQEIREARPFPPNIGWVIRDLSAERQAELMPVLEPLGEEIFPYRRAMFEAQRRVNDLMSASDYDEDELLAAFAELRSASEDYTSLSHQQTVAVLSQLTEEERQVATEFVQRRGPRDGRDGFRGPGGPGGPGFRPPFGPDGRRPPPDGPRPEPPADQDGVNQ